jgi:hypothetical protein
MSTFYVDSGAGQCLSSCSSAFVSLEPCHIEVVGIAGTLPIFGIGTASFALKLKGKKDVIIRIHNCLYSFGEFNLLSVSQMQTNHQTTLDLSLRAPTIRLYANDKNKGSRKSELFVDIPLAMDDGLYAMKMEPLSSEDPRNLTSQIFHITPPGEYRPLTQKSVKGMNLVRQMWTTTVLLAGRTAGRIRAFAGSMDFHSELGSFSDSFLAPAGLPPCRRAENSLTSQMRGICLTCRFVSWVVVPTASCTQLGYQMG